MTATVDQIGIVAPRRTATPALRYALRELRGCFGGFYVFMSCIALGVFAIAGVGALAASLSASLVSEGRTLLGGDASFSLIQREAKPDEQAFLSTKGELSVAATMRAMARSNDGQYALVELKAVDQNFPLLGALDMQPALPLADVLATRDGIFGAAADPALLARLNLKIGDQVKIGAASFAVRASINAEPDKLGGGSGFGPRFLVSEAGLRATALLQPGSLVRWTYRLRLADGTSDTAMKAVIDNVRSSLPDAGWEIRSRANASPQLERTIERFTQFLTLVGLAALLVGGVGVVNAVKGHLDRRRDVIATLKALGATSTTVFAIFVTQVLTIALVGSLIGLVFGAVLPFIVVAGFGNLLPLPIVPVIQAGDLIVALAYGLLTALAFAIWPLGRIEDVSVSRLFRDAAVPENHWPRRRYIALMLAAVAALIAIATFEAFDKKVALTFIGCAAAVFALLRLVALLLMAGARRMPRPSATMLRLALTNIHRPGALTSSVVLSLGLGLTVLVTITQIDGNLRRQFTAALPERAPSFFFVDIPSTRADEFQSFLSSQDPGAKIERVPMLRGRIVEARGVKAEELKPTPDAEWVLQSDRGLTYATDVPPGSKVVEGQWWGPNYDGPPLVSFEKKLAEGLGLKLGDKVTVNALGRNVTATIGNMRSVDWQSLGINFVLVFSPNTFRGAPHTEIATLTEPRSSPENDARIVKVVAEAFPNVTSVRVREALQTVGDVVNNLVLAIRAASGLTLVSAVLVLAGALAAGHRHRVYDAVILKTLGATRLRLIGAYAAEYLMIGLATALFGVLSGGLAAWFVVTRLMTLSFVFEFGSAVTVVGAALLVTVGLGLIGTLVALNQKPATVLRNL